MRKKSNMLKDIYYTKGHLLIKVPKSGAAMLAARLDRKDWRWEAWSESDVEEVRKTFAPYWVQPGDRFFFNGNEWEVDVVGASSVYLWEVGGKSTITVPVTDLARIPFNFGSP
jgi:hypothetical protein